MTESEFEKQYRRTSESDRQASDFRDRLIAILAKDRYRPNKERLVDLERIMSLQIGDLLLLRESPQGLMQLPFSEMYKQLLREADLNADFIQKDIEPYEDAINASFFASQYGVTDERKTELLEYKQKLIIILLQDRYRQPAEKYEDLKKILSMTEKDLLSLKKSPQKLMQLQFSEMYKQLLREANLTKEDDGTYEGKKTK